MSMLNVAEWWCHYLATWLGWCFDMCCVDMCALARGVYMYVRHMGSSISEHLDASNICPPACVCRVSHSSLTHSHPPTEQCVRH